MEAFKLTKHFWSATVKAAAAAPGLWEAERKQAALRQPFVSGSNF